MVLVLVIEVQGVVVQQAQGVNRENHILVWQYFGSFLFVFPCILLNTFSIIMKD